MVGDSRFVPLDEETEQASPARVVPVTDDPWIWLLPIHEAILIGTDGSVITHARRHLTHPAHPGNDLPKLTIAPHVGVLEADVIHWWLTRVNSRAGRAGRPLPAGVVARVRELAATRGITTPATQP